MSGTRIRGVDAWEALDSRGTPTVACAVTLADGSRGEARAPSGASTGRHEARELRDGGDRYAGRGVLAAAGHVRSVLAGAIIGMDAADQASVDAGLRAADGTADLSRTGGNAVVAVSVATALAAAASRRMPLWQSLTGDPLLPMPMVNIISGGAHAGGVIDVQDLLVIPVGASSFSQALEWSARVRRATAAVAAAEGLPASLVADEGGLAGALPGNRAAVRLLMRGIEASGLSAGDQVAVAIDVAASQFADADGYALRAEQRRLSAGELIAELAQWCQADPIISIEDPVGEDDWAAWRQATRELPVRQVVGDDLFATDPERLHRGIREGAANAVLVKVNQNGTLTGARTVLNDAAAAGYLTVLSARSGDTEDSWLADLAVGWRAGQIKVGSTTRSERTAKWNRLLHIEHTLGPRARFAGQTLFGGVRQT